MGPKSMAPKADFAKALRTWDHGRLRIDEQRLPPVDVEQFPRPERRRRQLLGRSGDSALAVHPGTHAICDRLAAEYPHMSDQALYDTARLVNAALMARSTPGLGPRPSSPTPQQFSPCASQLVSACWRAIRPALRAGVRQ